MNARAKETPMRRLLVALLVVAAVLAVPIRSRADDGKPISLGLFTPVQIVPEGQGVSGFRFSLIYGKNAFVRGFDLGLVNELSGGLNGVQWGFVSIVKGNAVGWQWNFVTLDGGTFEGLQMGFYNQARHVNGLQLGMVNHVETMEGVQIGLINIIQKGGMLPVFPIFNFSFK
jgi:hypothetical protein